MYLRKTQRKNKDGSIVRYLQLAHNYRDPVSKRPKPQILYNFGRQEDIDEDGLRRLVDSINRYLGVENEQSGIAGESSRFVQSRPMGAAWLLKGLWDRLDIGVELKKLAEVRSFPDPEGVVGCILAMVANRALDPMSKHATPAWLTGDVFVPETPDDVYDERLYRAMDFLLTTEEELQKAVFFSTADLLNLEVDLLLYDTTSSYFEMEFDDMERADRRDRWDASDRREGPAPTRPYPQVVNEPALRMKGHTKDHRPDRAQVVIGMAVTREGIPVRCWVFPGNTNDATTIATVKASLAGWKLHRVVWAVDRGTVSDDNLRELQKGGAHYVAGKKMRAGEASVEQALSRPGRFKKVRDNLEVKEVVVGEGERRQRFVVIRNPAQVERDREDRALKLERIEQALADLPTDEGEHTKAVCKLVAHPTLGRYLKKNRRGRLVVDSAKVKSEERLDGKYLVLTSDDSLSAEDVALSYKQLGEVERAWRSLKSDLNLRPMHHRKADRIKAHILLCWLALLLVRVVETRCGETWPTVRREMDRLYRGVFECSSGTFVQRTELSSLQRQYLSAVEVAVPPRFEAINTAEKQDTAIAL
jgi:hypothetical protein